MSLFKTSKSTYTCDATTVYIAKKLKDILVLYKMSLLQSRNRLETLETIQAKLLGSVDQNVGDTSALLNALSL